ncbi:AMPKBI domain-containing protein [Aphelenchoides besseyi]|nr:AMPKBI domain-containing protein [Aphelenchoides besseyi]
MGNTHIGHLHHKRNRTSDMISSLPSTPDDHGPVHMQLDREIQEDEFPVVFSWPNSNSNSQSVFLSGSWDEWKTKIPLVKSTSNFSTIINLNPGTYEYKFLVDGKWKLDATSPRVEKEDGANTHRITIDESDFEIWTALDRDFAASNAGLGMRNFAFQKQKSVDTPNDREIEKLLEFSQDIPDAEVYATAAEPPSLARIGMNYSLNEETPNSSDPNQLATPNHVMLNHLYAISIKDGVMVLSATHRHRRKFCTTIFYQPI